MDVKKVMYLIVKCTELMDQFECDYDREPLKVVSDYTPYDKKGFEIYEISTSGALTCIRRAYQVTENGVGLFWFKPFNYHTPSKVFWKKPDISLKNVPLSQIKEWFSEAGINDLDNYDLDDMLDYGYAYSIHQNDGDLVLADYEDDYVWGVM
jgi:hypothetical protein